MLNAHPLLAGQSQTAYAAEDFPSPALMSSFSPLYHFDADDPTSSVMSNSLVIHNPLQLEMIPANVSAASLPSIPYSNAELAQHYLKYVVDIQAGLRFLRNSGGLLII